MGTGSKRSTSGYRTPDGDEPVFGDPPRHWGRVVGMGGLWATVLLLGAWMAPGIASGGSSEETDARDRTPADEISAAWSYLRYASTGDTDRAGSIICDGASLETTPADLVDLRDSYDEELGRYPEIEVKTEEPVAGTDGTQVAATVTYIAGNTLRQEDFVVSVSSVEDGFCVSQVIREASDSEVPGTGGDPQDLAARYLSAIFYVRDLASAAEFQCAEYDGPEPQELADALEAWERTFGDANAIQRFDGDPTESGGETVVPMSVEFSSLQARESFTFEVTVLDDCVAALSGGEALLDQAEDE